MKSIMPDWTDPRIFSRPRFLQLMAAAFESGSYRFARQAALNWLAVFPGDLTVQFLLGRSHLAESKYAQGITILEKLCRYDPEFGLAQQALAAAYQAIGSDRAAVAQVCASALNGVSEPEAGAPEWAGLYLSARAEIRKGNYAEAEQLLLTLTAQQSDFILAAVDYLNCVWSHQDVAKLRQLAEQYHSQWPDCLQFSLRLAETEIEFANEARAIELLHECVANDATGQVVQRLWGKDFRYRPLWPEGLEVFLDLAVPAEVAFQMGWNRLPAGQAPPVESPMTQTGDVPSTVGESSSEERETSQLKSDDEVLREIEESFAKLAKKVKKPSIARADGRFPMYVILSTVKGLDDQYGPQTRDILIGEMGLLAENLSRRAGWGSLVFLPDHAERAKELGINPIDEVDPWKIKLALADLDQALVKKGQMIGSVLIVGGPLVVPFHRLPNPTDDMDQDIPSDNPYATLDSNYFVPEWPVGRIPGEAGKDAGFLLEQLRGMNRRYARKSKSIPKFGDLIRWLLEFLKQRSSTRSQAGIGYSAAVWKESSAVVYGAASESSRPLRISPPETSQSIPEELLHNSMLGYFNLHGLAETAEWYGQKDNSDLSNGPDYPVALSPSNITCNGKAPQVVYSEACFGANILDKKEDEALSLKFLAAGTKVFVGSTSIAYGSVTKPLIGADLLGYHFWKYLKEGLTAGEALLQAKAALVKEMTQRQGFLDGEDQKALISFVLFGDPLAGLEQIEARPKAIYRYKTHPKIKTICDLQTGVCTHSEISPEMLKSVKAIVEIYLPGLDDADFRISELNEVPDESQQDGKAAKPEGKINRKNKPSKVITVSKSVQLAKLTIHQYARVTLNEKGKLVKLAISR